MKIRMRKIIWFANVSISSTVRPMKNSETRRERSEQAEKDSFKKMNSDKLMSTSGRDRLRQFQQYQKIGNSNVRSFVSEKVKNFENCRTNVRNEAKES